MVPQTLQAHRRSASASENPPTERDLPSTAPDLDDAVEIFLAERTRLFRIAYGIVGSAAAAEDVVQEAWLRWQRCNRGEISNPAAFLATATTRLAINVIQSAGHRHETPANTVLAGLVDRSPNPAKRAEQSAAVEWALGLVLARLTPSQRAAYLLRSGFDYPYREIARILRTSVSNARQLVHRAQQSLVDGCNRQVDSAAHRRLVRTFVAAAQTGDLAELEQLLADGCYSGQLQM